MGRLVHKSKVADLDQQIAGLEQIVQSGSITATPLLLEAGDDYLTRMVKYVPVEVIAFSMVVNAILGQAMKSGGSDAAMAGIPVPIIAAGALVVGCMLTPLFCWYVAREGDGWITNAVVSTIAFPFWAYLMGAVAFTNHYDGNLAAILVMTFTAVSGLVTPKPERIKPAEQAQAETPLPETPRLVNALAG